jgi:hypothetical protein
MMSFYRKWRWIMLENAAHRFPWAWWQLLVCPFCRGMAAYVREQEQVSP